MIEVKELKERMTKKFKKMSVFCRCSGYDRTELQILMQCESQRPGQSEERQREMERISELIQDCSPFDDPIKITPKLRGEIQSAITDKGGVIKFCEENPDFYPRAINYILDGTRKKKTEMVMNLLNVLEIKA